MPQPHRTVDEWEAALGAQIRRTRVARGLTQQDLARLMDASVSAVRGLENGAGSSLKTLVRAARALGRTEWLDGFAPPVTVSPLQRLREQTAARPRQRVRASRRPDT